MLNSSERILYSLNYSISVFAPFCSCLILNGVVKFYGIKGGTARAGNSFIVIEMFPKFIRSDLPFLCLKHEVNKGPDWLFLFVSGSAHVY